MEITGDSIDGFFVTLLSNESHYLYPENVISSFTNELFRPLKLDTDVWMAGICEIYLPPFSISTKTKLSHNDIQTILTDLKNQNAKRTSYVYTRRRKRAAKQQPTATKVQQITIPACPGFFQDKYKFVLTETEIASWCFRPNITNLNKLLTILPRRIEPIPPNEQERQQICEYAKTMMINTILKTNLQTLPVQDVKPLYPNTISFFVYIGPKKDDRIHKFIEYKDYKDMSEFVLSYISQLPMKFRDEGKLVFIFNAFLRDELNMNMARDPEYLDALKTGADINTLISIIKTKMPAKQQPSVSTAQPTTNILKINFDDLNAVMEIDLNSIPGPIRKSPLELKYIIELMRNNIKFQDNLTPMERLDAEKYISIYILNALQGANIKSYPSFQPVTKNAEDIELLVPTSILSPVGVSGTSVFKKQVTVIKNNTHNNVEDFLNSIVAQINPQDRDAHVLTQALQEVFTLIEKQNIAIAQQQNQQITYDPNDPHSMASVLMYSQQMLAQIKAQQDEIKRLQQEEDDRLKKARADLLAEKARQDALKQRQLQKQAAIAASGGSRRQKRGGSVPDDWIVKNGRFVNIHYPDDDVSSHQLTKNIHPHLYFETDDVVITEPQVQAFRGHPYHINTNFLYVYLDICKPTIVGDKSLRLHRIVPNMNQESTGIYHNYTNVHYFQVEKSLISNISVQILNASGDRVKFINVDFSAGHAPAMIKLHFKRMFA